MAIYKLKDICLKIGSGATPKGGKEAYCDEGISLIRSQNVLDFTFSYDGLAHINDQQAEKLSNVEVKPQDILLNITGDSVARVCTVDPRALPARVNQHVAIIRPDENRVLRSYILYFLQMIKPYLLQIAAGGATRNALTKSMIENLELEVPDILSQKKIVSVLDDIQEKIRDNNEINKNLLEQARTLFISWFVDYTPFNGTKPDLWKNKSVYELAEYINGAAFKKNEYADKGLPIIKITELKNGITNATQYCCTEKDVKYYIDDRDILFSWSGNPDTSIDTFLWSNGKAILNQHTFRVVSKYNAPAFTFFLLKYLKPQFTHIASNKQTTGLGHVTVADLKRLQFCADENAIRDFNAITMPFFDMIFSNYKENQYLSSLRDTILPQLMSGKLDVSEIDL